MNLFEQATLGFDKVTQSDRDLWDAALEGVSECLQDFYLVYIEEELDFSFKDVLLTIEKCRSDGSVDTNDSSKRIVR